VLSSHSEQGRTSEVSLRGYRTQFQGHCPGRRALAAAAQYRLARDRGGRGTFRQRQGSTAAGALWGRLGDPARRPAGAAAGGPACAGVAGHPRSAAQCAQNTGAAHALSFLGQTGFEFLGFTLRQYPAGPVQRKAASLPLSGRAFASPEPSPGWQTVITPGEEATKRHLAVVSQRIGQVQAAPQAPLIRELNPLIGGWAAYYRGLVEEAVLGRSDEQMEHQLFQWARLRHPGKSREWLLGRYWQPRDERERVFATPDGAELRTYRQASRPHQNGGKGHRNGT